MTHNVYYTSMDNAFGYDIEPLRDHFINNIFTKNEFIPKIQFCPAFNDYVKNVFIIKSTCHYEIEWDGKNISSPLYNQEFFNKNILVRNAEVGLLSYIIPHPLFYSDSEDLNMSQEFPYFHDNNITNSAYVMPGIFNIGKHIPRPVELSVKFKRPGSIVINEGDALFYVRFHTTDKVIFKKFVMTNKLLTFLNDNLYIRKYTKNYKPLQWWYDLVKRHNYKKFFLKEIKDNLL